MRADTLPEAKAPSKSTATKATTKTTKTTTATKAAKTKAAKADLAKAAELAAQSGDYTAMVPGQKIDLKIQAAKAKAGDLQKQIKSLKTNLKSALNVKKMDLASKIKGLIGNLEKLEQNLEQEIKKLEAQALASIMSPEQKELMDTIQERCAGYIAEMKKAKKYLYRGSGGPLEYVGKSWETRKAKDSSQAAQNLFDQLLAQQGFVALRGNSIFTTSNVGKAGGYGSRVYFIFPIDGMSHYTYTVSSDLVLESISDVAKIDPARTMQIATQVTEIIKEARKTATASDKKSLGYTLDRLKWDREFVFSIIERYKEMKPKDRKFVLPDDLLDISLASMVDTKEFNNRWEPKHTNLAGALTGGKEIYVSGVYYALAYNKYKEIIEYALGIKVPKISYW